jgi:hypothetical protein
MTNINAGIHLDGIAAWHGVLWCMITSVYAVFRSCKGNDRGKLEQKRHILVHERQSDASA